ncbi:MAG: ParB/RepB/Spo0J family partition protein [Clostridia bacterium]|nr:ParB/RepB/Spo0J family partition protein [Clostridia bacterium]
MSKIIRIPIDRISPSPYQPRRAFDEAAIAALAESIRRFGLLSPLLVRRKTAGEYELIAGERRLRALQRLQCAHADAIILSAYDRDCALIGLIENLEREDLHFLDEARACRRIIDEQGLGREELAQILNCSPSALANRLRLLKLPEAVQQIIREDGLSERHARALLRLEDEARQRSLAGQAARLKWGVRQLESQIEKLLRESAPPRSAPRIRDKRLIINAFRDTLRQLKQIGVQASSRVEEREDSYDIIVTVQKST